MRRPGHPPFDSQPCPKCGAESKPDSWNEVDIGVGVQTFDHTWECPKHGEWCDGPDGKPVFRDEATP